MFIDSDDYSSKPITLMKMVLRSRAKLARDEKKPKLQYPHIARTLLVADGCFGLLIVAGGGISHWEGV